MYGEMFEQKGQMHAHNCTLRNGVDKVRIYTNASNALFGLFIFVSLVPIYVRTRLNASFQSNIL